MMRRNNNIEGDYEQISNMFHTLMPFKLRDILLVSSYYDAFIIEEEGLISELLIGQYRHLLLSSPPRVIRVNSAKKALSKLDEQHFDLVITMSKNIGMDPFNFGKRVKELHPNLPVILLAIDSTDIRLIKQKYDGTRVDKTFFWTGDPTLFLAIIKYVEDKLNAENDTRNGNVRVLIMLEDSIRYYSLFLPIFYIEIVKQTQRAISEDMNEMQQLLTRRARPKILLAETFEEGVDLFEQYKEYVQGIISDVAFKREGKEDPEAGFEFCRLIRKESEYIPILMQSSDPKNRERAEAMGTYFLNKNSPSLLQDFQQFLLNHIGFGDFIFLKPKKKKSGRGRREKAAPADNMHMDTIEIARASTVHEFVQKIQEVPLESIQFHAERNHFSNWLFARCEFKPALKMRPKRAGDFTDLNEVRKYLLEVFRESRREKQLGVITDFTQQKYEFESSFTRLTGDSLGGKGRGIAFMRALLARYNFEKKYKGIIISVPNTVVIGTLEFDRFIKDNNLLRFAERTDASDREIAKAFLKGKMHKELKEKLSQVLQHFRTPLAVRSSGLLEDSHHHPFAGLYSTYMLPNSHRNSRVRLKQLTQAIKLVYASVFFKEPREYITSTSSKVEEEKMAVIIQEMVGTDFGGRFYPTLSGVAQSYNFYPVSHQKFEDGVACLAVGLGKAVVGGEKVIRFSPEYPEIIPDFSSTELILENSQTDLYVLNTARDDFELTERDDSTLKKLNINDIKSDGSLNFIASTYNSDDGMVRDGFSGTGAPLITFSGILKNDAFPLADILKDVLRIGQRGMGCPIELEFAVNFDPDNRNYPTFSILQIRPLIPSMELCEISSSEFTGKENVFIRSDKALGTGAINSIKDIVYVSPKTFDVSKTVRIAEEIGRINRKLAASSTPYVLIGPGRWGTQDRWLGIPVKWSQISGVGVMIETAFEGFMIEPSQGTHFFQNIVSKGIGYIYTTQSTKNCFIDWDWLEGLPEVKALNFVKHVRLESPLSIRIDGKCGRALIEKPAG